jgi:flagellar hook assembly protein FlgD
VVATLVLGVLVSCATFRGQIPVTTDAPERTYISPGVPDGVQDRLIVKATVAAAYKDMRIGGYRFSVKDATGTTVRTIEESVVPPERKYQIVLRPAKGIPLPNAFIWEGRNDNGDLVPEGQYTYGVEAWDVYGNVGDSPELSVVVDNTPPSVTVSAPLQTFSPNGDGNQDTLLIRQANSSTEEEWRGEIRNAQGQSIRRQTWSGKTEDFLWDGKDDAGATVPDGTYRYTVGATDRAGNNSSFSLPVLHVDTRPGSAAGGERPRGRPLGADRS